MEGHSVNLNHYTEWSFSKTGLCLSSLWFPTRCVVLAGRWSVWVAQSQQPITRTLQLLRHLFTSALSNNCVLNIYVFHDLHNSRSYLFTKINQPTNPTKEWITFISHRLERKQAILHCMAFGLRQEVQVKWSSRARPPWSRPVWPCRDCSSLQFSSVRSFFFSLSYMSSNRQLLSSSVAM